VLDGLTVSSGLARGIDADAHRASLDAGGHTVAVMATGIDRIYPAGHRQLAADIEARGCLVTEFAPGQEPKRWHFPRRNRIISGLALATLVAEAALRSGSLITAGAALEQGREVFAVPHSLFHPGGAGCLQLLADGAGLARSLDDILASLGMLFRLQRDLADGAGDATADTLPRGLGQVLHLVGFEATSLDEVVSHSGLPVARVLAALSTLELEGHVQRRGTAYIRV
jgi:DNA processing protein